GDTPLESVVVTTPIRQQSVADTHKVQVLAEGLRSARANPLIRYNPLPGWAAEGGQRRAARTHPLLSCKMLCQPNLELLKST
ncbi:MAG: hypothetical protein KKD28_04705, partial [Chloroflexi bacterium]|nr:hypothetical protein [Chloroflexota bacterium]